MSAGEVASGSAAERGDVLGGDEVTFLLCVEANRLAPQARLLCESIRAHGGRYRQAPILAVSPRPHLALGRAERQILDRLGVTYVVEALNRTERPYGTINRIVAGAWAEAMGSGPYLVVLDTDTVFVGEPQLPRAAVGVRPVDVKGSASSGELDPLDAYWQQMCALGGLAPTRLPWLETAIDKVVIRASYNGGLTIVRRDLGLLAETRRIFFAALDRELKPWGDAPPEIHASTGMVDAAAGAWWGSSQAALSVAIWSRTTEVRVLDARYNLPLHILANPGYSWPTSVHRPPILLHYHFLAEPAHRERFRQAMTRVGCGQAARHWVGDRLSYFDR